MQSRSEEIQAMTLLTLIEITSRGHWKDPTKTQSQTTHRTQPNRLKQAIKPTNPSNKPNTLNDQTSWSAWWPLQLQSQGPLLLVLGPVWASGQTKALLAKVRGVLGVLGGNWVAWVLGRFWVLCFVNMLTAMFSDRVKQWFWLLT